MSLITTILATIVALEHFYIFYLESIATQSDATSRVFNMDKEELTRTSVKTKEFIMPWLECFLSMGFISRIA